MKKITLIAAILAATSFASAQRTAEFGTLLAPQTFESYSPTFSKTGNSVWGTTDIKDFYSSSTTIKTQVCSIDATAATVNDGTAASTQTMKLAVKEAIVSGATLKLRVNYVTATAAETYIAIFDAKTDASGSQTALLNKQDVTTPISSTWTRQYVQCTVQANTYIFAIQPLSIGSDYNLWIDNLSIKLRPAPVTTLAATDVTSSGFTANWNAITNATSYKVYLYTSTDNGATWNAQSLANAIVTTNSHTFTGLTPNTMYGYRVTSTDGEITSGFSSTYQSVTTQIATDVNEITANTKIEVKDGALVLTTTAGQTIEVYNSLGQKEASVISIDGENTISAKSKGVHIVKVGKTTTKVVL